MSNFSLCMMFLTVLLEISLGTFRNFRISLIYFHSTSFASISFVQTNGVYWYNTLILMYDLKKYIFYVPRAFGNVVLKVFDGIIHILVGL